MSIGSVASGGAGAAAVVKVKPDIFADSNSAGSKKLMNEICIGCILL